MCDDCHTLSCPFSHFSQTRAKPEPNPNQTRTKPEPNPSKTRAKPEPNPSQTHAKPKPNPRLRSQRVCSVVSQRCDRCGLMCLSAIAYVGAPRWLYLHVQRFDRLIFTCNDQRLYRCPPRMYAIVQMNCTTRSSFGISICARVHATRFGPIMSADVADKREAAKWR